MAYNVNTFLKPLSQSDRLIQIVDSNGIVKYSINPFTVKNTFVRGNVIYISLNSDREILIDFRNQTESRQAIVILESQLETLRNKTPNYIDRIIEEYIQGIGLSYSNGNLYFSANLIPSINSTFSIGLSGSNWLDLYVGTSSIYIGDAKLSSEGSNLIINDSFEISNPTQSTTWLGKKLIENFTDGIITTVDETRSHLYSEIGEIGLESYNNPDGPNNTERGKVRTFPGGVVLESSSDSVGGIVIGNVIVSANGFQFNQTDGVIDNNFEMSNTLYINGVDYLSKGGTLSQTFLINSNNYDYIINDADSLILSSSVFDVVSNFISLDSTGSIQILADEDIGVMATGELSIVATSSIITTMNERGLVYTSDYSLTFDDNSLVTKKFVLDTLTASIYDLENSLSIATASIYDLENSLSIATASIYDLETNLSIYINFTDAISYNYIAPYNFILSGFTSSGLSATFSLNNNVFTFGSTISKYDNFQIYPDSTGLLILNGYKV